MADYLKIPEVARRLDVSEPTVRRMVKGGKLPSVFVGGAYRVNEEDLEAYLDNAKVIPGKASAPPSQDPLFNGGRDEERRIPSLRRWIDLTGRMADRWEAEFEEREAEWQSAEPHIKKNVKLLPNLSWATEILQTYTDILAAVTTELHHGLYVYETAEVLELFKNTQRLEEVCERTNPWYPGKEAPRTAEVIDLKQAMAKRVEEIEARSSQSA